MYLVLDPQHWSDRLTRLVFSFLYRGLVTILLRSWPRTSGSAPSPARSSRRWSSSRSTSSTSTPTRWTTSRRRWSSSTATSATRAGPNFLKRKQPCCRWPKNVKLRRWRVKSCGRRSGCCCRSIRTCGAAFMSGWARGPARVRCALRMRKQIRAR